MDLGLKSAPRASDVLVDAVGNCPLDLAIRTIGGKWKLLILRVLFLSGGERYNNLLRVIPDITPKKRRAIFANSKIRASSSLDRATATHSAPLACNWSQH
ncbi:winged helix-turn-helix transcriptional regulator [Paraburkholderia fungorum]